MEFRDIPKASQQKVYIDTKCINDVYLFQYYFYRLVNYLSSCGYEIVFDVNSVDDDTFFFTPCIDTYLEKTAKIFKIRKQKKILDVLYDYDIVKPYTAELDEHLFDIIDVPFVIKN